MQEVDIEEKVKMFQKYKAEERSDILNTLFALLIMLVTLLCLMIDIRWLKFGLTIYMIIALMLTIFSVIDDIKTYLNHKKTFETYIQQYAELHEDD